MNYLKVLLIGIAATGVMTAFMLLAPFIGLPRMNAGEILGSMWGGSRVIGWVEHFLAGIIFAFVYAKYLNRLLPVENNIARGAIYGILLCILTDAVFAIISLMGNMNFAEKESMALMVCGETLACLIYGTMLGAFMTEKTDVPAHDHRPETERPGNHARHGHAF